MLRFTIESENKSFVALAPIEIGRLWVDDLTKYVAKSSDSGGSSQDDLLIAPLWKQDSSSSSCEVCDAKFHALLRRRHHCRKCGRLVCNSCFTTS